MNKTNGIILLALSVAIGCGAAAKQSNEQRPPAAETISQIYDLKLQDAPADTLNVEVIAEGLETPWTIAFLPDGSALVTERPGRLRVIRSGVLATEPIGTIAEAAETGGEGGLMGLAVHPEFSENRWIYVSFTHPNADGFGVKVVRYTLRNDQLSDPKTILEGIEGGRNHDGCALGFGPDGKLYITTGERYKKHLASDMTSLNGKTLRLNDDGTVPEDNPFAGKAETRPEIWSFGHRNAQGMDWQPGTGLFMQAEHGPSGSDAPGGGDEVNIVEKGADYGWPRVHHRELLAGTEPPILEYTPALAPGGAAFYKGTLFGNWKGDFLFTALRGTSLIRVDMDGAKPVAQYKMLTTYGRLRAIANAPDGSIWVGTSNRDGRARARTGDDKILRLTPKE